jgi:hypothetical protein
MTPTPSDFAPNSTPEITPFTNYNDVLAEAEVMFQARRSWKQASANDQHAVIVERKERRYRELRSTWHLRAETSDLPLCRQSVAIGLSGLERELLWGALSRSTAESGSRDSGEMKDLLEHIAVELRERLAAIAHLTPESSLIKHEILFLGGDLDDNPLKVEIHPASTVLDEIFRAGLKPAGFWDLREEHELYGALRRLYRLWDHHADELSRFMRFNTQVSDFQQRRRKAKKEWDTFSATIKRHQAWSWNHPEIHELEVEEQKILVALAAHALEILPEESKLFTGLGLTSLLASSPDGVRFHYCNLQPHAKLLREQWIRPITEDSQHYTGVESEIAKTRFELDDRAFEVLVLERAKRQTIAGVTLRDPKIALGQLALSPSVAQSIQLTVTHAHAERRLFQEWGLAERIQYGIHPVLLFYGPPGTGKTATAEALAHELRRPLIVADYSKIQNPYVGMTEKNIVRVFQEARRRKAVLFWDEADAMLYDRDDAVRSWEVRDVNVILQQIERFEGVCILATNRRKNLDKALSRRISMQVEFKRPQTAAERLRIWNAMLPPELPMDSSVDLGLIAQEDLSGGEIKNVLLNAARFAAARKEAAPRLTHADFEEAVRWETQAQQEKRDPVGFCRASLR